MVNDLLSVIVRFHDSTRIAQLDEALFSLSTQSYQKIQVILTVQNGSPVVLKTLENLLSKQPFLAQEETSSPNIHKVIAVPVAEGIDGRSHLLNQGVEAAEGRFLAFLDYDDVVYPSSYDPLIQNILHSGCPIAVGGCRLAIQSWSQGPYTESKRAYLSEPKTKLDLFGNNFIPIHSFVIDLSAADRALLKFDVALKCFEDYEVLLKLASQYEFDFTALSIPMVEYRIRNDGTNTIPTSQSSPAVQKEWQEAKMKINQLKQSLQVSVNASDLQKLIEERDQLLLERKSLSFRVASLFFNLGKQFPMLKKAFIAPLKWLGAKTWKLKRTLVRLIRFND